MNGGRVTHAKMGPRSLTEVTRGNVRLGLGRKSNAGCEPPLHFPEHMSQHRNTSGTKNPPRDQGRLGRCWVGCTCSARLAMIWVRIKWFFSQAQNSKIWAGERELFFGGKERLNRGLFFLGAWVASLRLFRRERSGSLKRRKRCFISNRFAAYGPG